MITQSSAANTASQGSTNQRLALGTDGKVLAITPTAPQRKVLVNLTCYHCPEKMQGMDERGHPYLHCLLLGAPVNPKACGREYAGGCDE